MQGACTLCSKQNRVAQWTRSPLVIPQNTDDIDNNLVAHQLHYWAISLEFTEAGFLQTVSFLSGGEIGQVSKRLEIYSDPDIPSILVCFSGLRQVWGVKGWDSPGPSTDAVSQMWHSPRVPGGLTYSEGHRESISSETAIQRALWGDRQNCRQHSQS